MCRSRMGAKWPIYIKLFSFLSPFTVNIHLLTVSYNTRVIYLVVLSTKAELSRSDQVGALALSKC